MPLLLRSLALSLLKEISSIMTTKSQIQKMLTQVIDPELGKNIVAAGMVRNIQIEDSC